MLSLVLFLVMTWATSAEGQNQSIKMTKVEEDPKLTNNIEQNLLSVLGLRHKPAANASALKVPSYMIRLYNIRSSDAVEDPLDEDPLSNVVSLDDDHFSSDTVRAYYHKSHAEDDLLTPEHSMLLHFNVSGIPSNEVLQAVQLMISYERHSDVPQVDASFGYRQNEKKKWLSKDLEYLQRLRVYDVMRPARGNSGAIHRLLDTKVIDVRTNGTLAFDVGSALHRWLKRPRTNFGLYVELVPLKSVNNENNYLHIRIKKSVRNIRESEELPLLLVHTNNGERNSRAKRSSGYEKVRQHCQKHSLYVDFRKVEWDSWIVAPVGYDAFFCSGNCPYPLADHMNSTNHAVVQNLVHSRYPSRVPTPCCVPTEHSAISMLYFDEDERVVLKTYQNMVVESCGCR